MIKKILVFLWLLIFSESNVHAQISSDSIGQLLGYPPANIIIEDITDTEINILGKPTLAELRRGDKLPTADDLFHAYRISSNIPNTFFPIQIYYAKKGTFFTSEIKEKIEKIQTYPNKAISEGGRGALGAIFGSLSEGGLYSGDLKTPFKEQGSQVPGKISAMISIFVPVGKNYEIRIAMVSALGNAADLVAFSGAEKYYNSFQSEDNETKANHNLAKLFEGLNDLAIAQLISSSTLQKKVESKHILNYTNILKNETSINSIQSKNTLGYILSDNKLWVSILVLAFTTIIIVFLKKRRD